MTTERSPIPSQSEHLAKVTALTIRIAESTRSLLADAPGTILGKQVFVRVPHSKLAYQITEVTGLSRVAKKLGDDKENPDLRKLVKITPFRKKWGNYVTDFHPINYHVTYSESPQSELDGINLPHIYHSDSNFGNRELQRLASRLERAVSKK